MRLRKLVQNLGYFNSILYLINRLATKVKIKHCFIKYYFVAQPLGMQAFLPKGRGKNLEVIELPSGFQPHPCPRPEAVIADRYRQGAVCLAAYKDYEFAGCFWYLKQQYQEDEVRCLYKLASGNVVWDFDVYVEPKFRLSPVFLKLWDEASVKLTTEGVGWSFSRISAFNALSLSSQKRMGALVIGWAVFMRLGLMQLTVASLFPYIHISLSENKFPIFTLQLPDLKAKESLNAITRPDH